MKTKITIQNEDWSIEHTTWPVTLVDFIEQHKNAINIILESKHSIIEMTKLKDGNYRCMSKPKLMCNRKKWFTMVEALVVMTILAIIATIMFIAITEHTENLKEDNSWYYISDISEDINNNKPITNRVIKELGIDTENCLDMSREAVGIGSNTTRQFIFEKCMKLLWY